MFQRLGRFCASSPWLVCLAWLGLACGLALVAPHWDAQAEDDDVSFVPERFTSVRAYQLLQQAFPKDVFASRIVFVAERVDGPLTDADFRVVQAIVKDLEHLRDESPELKLGKIDSFQDGIVGTRMTSTDHRCTLVQASLDVPYLALATVAAVDAAEAVVRKRLGAAGLPGLEITTTGAAGIGRDMTKAAGSGLDGTTWATLGLVIIVLLAVYRAPLLALVPLLTIGVSVWVSLSGLSLLTLLPGVHLVNVSRVFSIVILYGAGTDYCLFLISRYREELQGGLSLDLALTRGVAGVGTALAASAGTVMIGLGLMACAEFAKLRCAGPAISVSLGVALVASLTLTPALLRLLGKHVFWPLQPPGPCEHLPFPVDDCCGWWDRISHWVARRPGLVWCAAAVPLVPLVIVGLLVRPDYRATGELSAVTPSLKGLATIQRHFTAGEIGPITVLLASDTDWSSSDGRMLITHLSRGFARLPNVAEVRSLTQPLGMSLPELRTRPDGHGLLHELLLLLQPLLEDLHQEVQQTAREHYVAAVPGTGTAGTQYVTRLDVVLQSDPFEAKSAETLGLIQTWLRAELPNYSYVRGPVRAECFGITANGQDLAEVTEGDRVRVNCLVLAAILLILLVLVRHLWMALYLLATVLASYYAALGATALVSVLWTGSIALSLDWRVPFFLFTILVAVGEDYNILLVCRAIQERKRHGPVEGMRRALSRTGAAITSCGLIMAGTFATLMLAGLNTLMQTGFALAFGVLVDTFLVRPFLVPACAMVFWGHRPSPKHPSTPAHPSSTATPRPRQAA